MAKCNIDRTYYSALGKLFNTVGAAELTGAQLSKVSRISDDVLDVLRTTTLQDEKGSDFSSVRRDALSYFYMFNDSRIINDAIDMLNKVEYYCDETYDYAMFQVLSRVVNGRTGAYKVPAKVIVPENMKKTSSVFMAHEITHMLKERNELECKDLTNFGEVIPMLMELIIAYSHEYEDTESIFGKRSEIIKCSAKSFKELYAEYKNNATLSVDKEMKTAMTESGLYVNSFYYTLALFSFYLKDSRYILSLIAEVLNCNMTTRDLINLVIRDSYDMYLDGLREFNNSL